MSQAEVLERLRASGALHEGHFELSSGRHSDRFFQCALLLADPRQAEAAAKALVAALDDSVRKSIDLVVGPALGAVTWAHEMARALGVRSFFTERKDGVMSLRRGFAFKGGERVLVVEDVLTTGGSAREVVRLLRELGAKPVHVGVIVNRSGGNPFEADGLELSALATLDVASWDASECPLCAAGGSAYKPGSRPTAAGSAAKGSGT